MDNMNMNQGYQQQSVYQQPEAEMSVGAWIGTLILATIPIVNIIMLIIWAVNNDPAHRNRKNWAIAQIVITVIIVVISIICSACVSAMVVSMMEGLY